MKSLINKIKIPEKMMKYFVFVLKIILGGVFLFSGYMKAQIDGFINLFKKIICLFDSIKTLKNIL